jgi:FkbM family methyltransferase|tara:strand:- start:2 stop:724 length:723 start_codon:yes stop_codon:yes gene_type:complete
MHLNLSEKIFSFFHRFIEKKYHMKRLSKILRDIAFFKYPTIFDVGGNEGESIDFFLNLYDNPKIYSFEPETKSYQKLLRKYRKNKAINLFKFAFGNRKEELKLKVNVKSSTSTLSKINTKSKYYHLKSLILNRSKNNFFLGEEKVKVKKIDDFFYQKKIKTIHILKIDTEGFEFNVIKGAKKALKKTKIIIIEFQLNDMYLNYNPKRIENFLINNNFTLIAALKFPFMLYEDRIYINKKY